MCACGCCVVGGLDCRLTCAGCEERSSDAGVVGTSTVGVTDEGDGVTGEGAGRVWRL